MDLPELPPAAAVDFADAEACKAWIGDVPLANVAMAQHQLLVQLERLNRVSIATADRLAIMEVLREAVNFVQIEQAKRFANRAHPMAEAEAAVFEDTKELWEQMRLGYLHCLESAREGDAAMRRQAALLCQRALSYSGLKMFHHYRAYRQVPPRDWRGLHEVYAIAEQLGVAEGPVKDLLNRDVHDTSPRIAYARAVLMGMCNPNELSQRQLTFVAYLLEGWAAKLEVLQEPAHEGEDLPPLVADLAGEGCPQRLENVSPPKAGELRYLDTRNLAKSLRNRVALLRKGESPAKLALGEDCVQPSCEQMLVFLFRQWCQAKPERSTERKRASDSAEAGNDLAAIHYFISGRFFRQPGGEKELTQKQRQEIATFGRFSTRDEEDYGQTRGFALEQWHIEEERAQELRMVRRAGDPGRRYSHGQLVCVRPSGAKSFMLGQVRWLMAAESGDLHAGIKLLPGLPAAAAVRATGLNARDAKYEPALALAAVPALNVRACLVLSTGWYKPRRVIEVVTDSAVHARLTEVIERGADFERVAYEALSR